MTISAWYMDDGVEDQREEHKLEPSEPVTAEKLLSLGVLSWEGLTGPEDPILAKIRVDRGYTYNDEVRVSPDKLPNYEQKIKDFFREHIHYDEEIRFCVEGSGYFDIRDENDKWIRVSVQPGDLIIIPEGIYHRFTCDSKDYIHAMRLFVGEPVWTPYNRDEIDEKKNDSRRKFVEQFLEPLWATAAAVGNDAESATKRQKVEGGEEGNDNEEKADTEA